MRPARCFEDLRLGERRKSRMLKVSRDEMIDFARHYDPQWFHADADAASTSVFGDVVASGIYILALWRRLDHEINGDIDFVCGVGWDDLRILKPVRAGDEICATSEILNLVPSRSTPERGTAIMRYAVSTSDGFEALHFTSINLVYTRAAREAQPG